VRLEASGALSQIPGDLYSSTFEITGHAFDLLIVILIFDVLIIGNLRIIL